MPPSPRLRFSPRSRTFLALALAGLGLASVGAQPEEDPRVVVSGSLLGMEGEPDPGAARDLVLQAQAAARTLDPEKFTEAKIQALAPVWAEFESEDRHQLNRDLHAHEPLGSPSFLIVAFEGTGAFAPRLASSLNQLQKTLPRHPQFQAGLEAKVRARIEAETGQDEVWSGLIRGPFRVLLDSPHLFPGGYDWKSYPSEESELLSGTGAAKARNFNPLQWIRESERSFDSRPLGIEAALAELPRQLESLATRNPPPKLVILSHSSGGRSAVKFLEHLKRIPDPRTGKAPIEADLVFTIDPVREAHEAVLEVARSLTRKVGQELLDWIPGVPEAYEKPRVRSRSQPESLYKTSNAKRWINVLQTEDTEGMKGAIPFGIHGSPIENADFNGQILGVGSDGHGSICFAKAVTSLFLGELRRLGVAR